ncbi:MAG: FCD domain-containing protein [Azoarcus sp.]|nr:FCD domain-containing protein [Azoarcus sp.]
MPSIANIAAQALQRRIANGEFVVGAALPSQRELSAQLSISRASLREAISTLEALGLVRAQPGKGVFVTAGHKFDPDHPPRGTEMMTPQALIELRAALEPTWAGLAALRIDDAGLAQLETIQRGMEDALKVCDLVMAADWDLQFHLLLAELSDNPGLIGISHQFSEQIGHSLRLPFSNRAAIWAPADEHRRITSAIASRNAASAAAAMREHLAAAAARVGIAFPSL